MYLGDTHLFFSGILLLLVLGTYLYLFLLSRKIPKEAIRNMQNRIDALELEIDQKILHEKERLQEQIRQIQERLNDFETQSSRNAEIFKTVLYGFDFIVQGCKKALEIQDLREVEKKLEENFELVQEQMTPHPVEEQDVEKF